MQYLFDCHGLPPNHPQAIHPALLNTIYLVGCSAIGGLFDTHIPYLLCRTRELLQESLAFVDRLNHFLWASVVFASWLGKSGYFNESVVVAGSTARFALGCGLAGDDHGEALMPPPMTAEDAADRIQVRATLLIPAIPQFDTELAIDTD